MTLIGAQDVSHMTMAQCQYLTLAAFSNKVVTASPSGNFLMFDVNRGKLGMWSELIEKHG